MDFFRRILAQLRAYWVGLSRLRRALLVGVTAVVVIALAAFAYLSTTLDYRPLFAGELAPEEVGAITTRLQGQNIPFKLNAAGTVVTVPEDRLATARVALAAEGLPVRGGKGYELFDESSLMTTPFVQS